MEQINFSILDRVRYNGTDINHLYIDGQLVWLKHTTGFYYLGQTIYCNGGPLTLNKLARTLNVSGINESGDLVTVNVQTDSNKLSFNPSDNTTAFQVGQIIYVDDFQATIDGIVGNQIYYTLLSGATGDTDTTLATNITVGRGGSDSSDPTAEVDTTSIPDSVTAFPDELVGRTIRGKEEKPDRGLTVGGLCVITEINGTTAFTTCGGVGILLGHEGTQWDLLDTASVTVFTVGSVVYINGKQAIIQGEDSDTIFIQYTDGSGFDSVAKDDTARLSFTGNVTGYDIGDTIYVNGRQAEVTGVAGAIVTYKYTDNTYGSTDTGTLHGERTLSSSPTTFGGNTGSVIYVDGQPGTVDSISGNDLTVTLNDNTQEVIDLTLDVTVSLDPNITGYEGGDIFYLNGVRCEVIGVTGALITFRDHYGTVTTIDPTTLTGVSESPSNFTVYSAGVGLYHLGTYKVIYTIEGNIITFQDNTVVDYSTNSADLSLDAPNTTSFLVGNTVYINGVAKVITRISGQRLFFGDGTAVNDDDSTLSSTATSLGGEEVGLGDTIWVGDQEKTIAGLVGNTATLDDGTTVELDDADVGTSRPNYTGFDVTQKVYIGTVLKTITEITGFVLSFEDGSTLDTTTGTAPTIIRPNYTSFVIGNTIFVGLELKTISDILGNVITFTDGSSVDASTATNLSLVAPNQTSFSVDQVVYKGTEAKTIESILGTTLTFVDTTTADQSEVSSNRPNYTLYHVGQELYIDGASVVITGILGSQIEFDNGLTLTNGANNISDAPKYLGGVTSEPLYKGLILGHTSDSGSQKVEITGVFNDGSMQFTPSVGGTNLGNWSPNTQFTWIDPSSISQSVTDGDTLYINGNLKTIAFVDGGKIHFEDGTSVLGADSSVSTVANTTGYNVGDEFFINGTPAEVTSVAGTIMNYLANGVAGTGNPNSNPGSFKDTVDITILFNSMPGSQVKIYGATGSSLGNTFSAITIPSNGQYRHDLTISNDIDIVVEYVPLWTHTVDKWTSNFSHILANSTSQQLGVAGYTWVGQQDQMQVSLSIKADITYDDIMLQIDAKDRHTDMSGNSANFTGYYAGFNWARRITQIGAPQVQQAVALLNSNEALGAVQVPVPAGSIAYVVSNPERWASGTEMQGQKVRRYWTDEEFNSQSASSGYDSRYTAVVQDAYGEFLASHDLQRDTSGWSSWATITAIESQQIYDVADEAGREVVETTDNTTITYPSTSLQNKVAMGSVRQENGDLNLVLWVADEVSINSAYGNSFLRIRRFEKVHYANGDPSSWAVTYTLDHTNADFKEAVKDMDDANNAQDVSRLVCSDDGKTMAYRDGNDVLSVYPDMGYGYEWNKWEIFMNTGIFKGDIAISGDGHVIAVGDKWYSAGQTNQNQALKGQVFVYVRRSDGYYDLENFLNHPDNGNSSKRSHDFGESIDLDYYGERCIVGSSIAQIDVGGWWVFDSCRAPNGARFIYGRFGSYGDEGYGSAVKISACGSYFAIGAIEYENASGASYNGGRVEFWAETSYDRIGGSLGVTKRFEKRADSGSAWRGGRQWSVDMSPNAQSVSIHFPRAPRTVSQAEALRGDIYASPDGNVVFGHTDVYYTGMGNVQKYSGGQTITLPYNALIVIANTYNELPYPIR